MDKYEYRIKAEQIVKLIGRGDYATAMKIADGIDWNRVKNVQMLCSISEIYEKNGKYEESRDILLLAYDRSPIGRMIVYRMVELSILLEDYEEAIAYYKEYEQIAPNDTNLYILKYKIYKGRGATIETLIAILEEFKRKDYHEEWAYELSRLYHEGGYGEQCTQECDEIDLWFNDGPTVMKALELKMCYKPLTPQQQVKYDHRNDVIEEKVLDDLETLIQQQEPSADAQEISPEDELAKTVPEEDSSPVEELKGSEDDNIEEQKLYEEEQSLLRSQNTAEIKKPFLWRKQNAETSVWNAEKPVDIANKNTVAPERQKTREMPILRREKIHFREEAPKPVKESDIVVPKDSSSDIKEVRPKASLPENFTSYTDLSEHRYDTLNLQKELAKSIQQLMDATEKDTVDETLQNVKKMVEQSHIPGLTETMRFRTVKSQMLSNAALKRAKELEGETIITANVQPESITIRPVVAEPTVKLKKKDEKKVNIDEILTQEGDGQIGLVLPSEPVVEKQITGQMNIEEIVKELERQKLLSENDKEKIALEEARKKALVETQEIMGEIMRLLKDVLPKIDSLKDGEERMVLLASSLEKVQNFLPEFSNEILKDAKSMHEEVSREVGEEPSLEDADAAEAIESKIEETIPQEISALLHDTEDNYCKLCEELFSKVELETEYEPIADQSIGDESSEDEVAEFEEAEFEDDEFEEALIAKAFSEMQDSIRQEEEKSETIMPEEELPTGYSDDEKSALLHMFTGEEEVQGEAAATSEPESYEASFSESEGFDVYSEPEQPEGIDVDYEPEQPEVYRMNEEQENIFAYFMSINGMRNKLNEVMERSEHAIENFIITGESGSGKVSLAMRIVKAMQEGRVEKTGTMAKIKGASLNHKDLGEIFEQVNNGVLIIDKAGSLTEVTMKKLESVMEEYGDSVQLFLADRENAIEELKEMAPSFMERFAVQIDLPVYSNTELVEFGKAYAKVHEYAIDDVAVLALYSCIGKLQLDNHSITLNDVKDLVDVAIIKSEKRSKGLFGRLRTKRRKDEWLLLEDDFENIEINK